MKVLYVVSLFPCWSETFIVREIRSLKEMGVDVHILSLKKSKEEIVQSDTESLIDNVIYPPGWIQLFMSSLMAIIIHPVINISLLLSIVKSLYRHPLSLLKSIFTFFLTLGVLEKVKESGVEHIHAHWATYPSTSALILSKNSGIPFSFTSHAHDIFLEDHMLKTKINESMFSVTISKYNKQRLAKQLNIDIASKMNVIHCAIDIDTYKYVDNNRLPNEIISVGRLDYIKGFSVLIDACKLFKDNNPDFKCKIIGNGPLKNSLQNQIDRNGLADNVRLVGVMKQEEIRELLSSATFFVLPSVITDSGDMDGIPVALMEAMAAGLPVISTTVSGIPELIQNDFNGLVVSPEDPVELSQAMERMLDRECSSKYALNARKTIESEFAIKIETSRLYSLISDSINQSSIRNV
ncbi:MAG TPA: glycosyltransferase family 4 protein [Gammaproteobacteria bacterium]